MTFYVRIEFYIGLPADVADDRRAVFHASKRPDGIGPAWERRHALERQL